MLEVAGLYTSMCVKSVGGSCYTSLPLLTDKYSSQFGGGSQYAYFHEEDETSFQLVDTARTQKTAYQRNRMRFAQVGQGPAILPSWSHYHWLPPCAYW